MRGFVPALALALGSSCSDEGAKETPTKPQPPQPIDIVDLQGLDAALATHRGRGVLLNFWAVWCAPCVAELPELMEVAKEFESAGGDVVLVSYDLIVPEATREQALEDVTAFAQKRGIEVPILIFSGPSEDALNTRFELPGGIPVTVALDRDGRIVGLHDGQATKSEFEDLMRTALGK